MQIDKDVYFVGCVMYMYIYQVLHFQTYSKSWNLTVLKFIQSLVHVPQTYQRFTTTEIYTTTLHTLLPYIHLAIKNGIGCLFKEGDTPLFGTQYSGV